MSLFGKLKQSLSKSTRGIGDALRSAVGLPNGRVDAETLTALEDALIMADVGVETASALIEKLEHHRFKEGDTIDDVKAWLANHIASTLQGCEQPFTLPSEKPTVILFIGVNGSGKTTTIGKLAQQWRKDGKKVLLAAGDTYRAGAAQQLAVWAKRAKVPLVQADTDNADPAGLIFKAYEQAEAENADILLCDTAGRLQNRQDLMDELAKIKRVLQKKNPAAPHATWLVLDGTVGQNALQQVDAFKELADVTGLIVTKLDGSAKAGVVVALAEKFKLPIYYIGIGENAEDLRPFGAEAFAKALVG